MDVNENNQKLISMPIGHLKTMISSFATAVDHGPLHESEGPYFAARLVQALYEQFFDSMGTGDVDEHWTFHLDLQALTRRLHELGVLDKCHLDDARGLIHELLGTVLSAFDDDVIRVTVNVGLPAANIAAPPASDRS